MNFENLKCLIVFSTVRKALPFSSHDGLPEKRTLCGKSIKILVSNIYNIPIAQEAPVDFSHFCKASECVHNHRQIESRWI